MNEIKQVEEIVKEYGPMALEKLESVAFITGASTIVQSLIFGTISMVVLSIMYIKRQYIIDNEDNFIVFMASLLGGVFSLIILICCSAEICNVWNYIAMYDGQAWAIHELIKGSGV